MEACSFVYPAMACFSMSTKMPWKLAVLVLLFTCGSISAKVNEQPYACGSAFVHLPFCDKARSVESRVSDLLSRLTLEEKIDQLVSSASNISHLGIPAYYWWSEALHGLSDNGPGVRFGGEITTITTFPQVILSAASFNRTLWNLIAQAVSTEARAMYNAGQAGLTFWSPNINIFRDPRWGRGQETPGEDPFLTSEYAIAYVAGLQDQEYNEDFRHLTTFKERKSTQNALKVAACCKHFTAYDLEAWGGYTRYTFDALVTLQDLVDTYHPPFQSCVQDAQAMCVMCSYNRLNGIPTCADSHLLTQLLRRKWGFKGYVTSDCDAVAVVYEYIGYASSPEDAVADCLNAGIDLNCGTYVSRHAAAAIQKGTLNISTINRALANLLTLRIQLGLFDGDPKLQPFGHIGPEAVCTDNHRQLALEAARQGLVLLKNEARTLPLFAGHINKLAVIGPNANASTDALLGNYAGPPCATVTPIQGLQKYVDVVYEPGCIDVACVSDSLVQAATEIALLADAVILFVGLNGSQEGEDHDRTDLLLPGKQQSLISRVVSAATGAVVLVIMSGGPVDISFARDNSKIQSIVWAGYPGEAGGQAIAELVFGDFSPGGRLPVTWYPDNFMQVPMTDMNMRPNPSRGYPGRTHRFYSGDAVFKFGHGLSYMDVSEVFASAPSEIYLPTCVDHFYQKILMVNSTPSICHVSDAQVNNDLDLVAGFNVSIQLSNHGLRGGSHTVLLFSRSFSGHVSLPKQQLVDFKRVILEPNSSLDVSFFLNPYKHFSVVNEHGRKVLNIGPHILVVNDKVEHMVLLKLSGAMEEVCC
eukprot:c22737_g1_i1 orf=367-2805(-)